MANTYYKSSLDLAKNSLAHCTHEIFDCDDLSSRLRDERVNFGFGYGYIYLGQFVDHDITFGSASICSDL
jgi:hypothetical protein